MIVRTGGDGDGVGGAPAPAAVYSDPAKFVLQNTRLSSTPLLPTIELHLAHEMIPLWQLTEEALTESGIPPPFWAFAWAGGQALARFVLDRPELVKGRRVLDFATGSGIVAIAAAKAGAQHVLAADLDPLALAACQLNAAANDVDVTPTSQDLIGHLCPEVDVILAGDVFYERPMADRVEEWLRQAVTRGIDVWVGDPERTYFPRTGVERLAQYSVVTTRELEDSDVRRTSVWSLVSPASWR